MIRVSFIIVCCIITMAILFSCRKNSEEEKVRGVIIAVQKGTEDRSLRDVLNHISRSYADPKGNDYASIKDLLLLYFFHNQNITVVLTGLEASVSGDHARAEFQTVLSGRSAASQSFFPESLGVYRFDVTLNKVNESWKVTSAVWERLGDEPPVTQQ